MRYLIALTKGHENIPRPLDQRSITFFEESIKEGFCSFSLTAEKKEPKETATPQPLQRGFN